MAVRSANLSIIYFSMFVVLVFYVLYRYEKNVDAKESAGKDSGIIGNPRIAQDDPALVSFIRDFYLTPPSSKPYDLVLAKDPNRNPSEYGADIMKIFGRKEYRLIFFWMYLIHVFNLRAAAKRYFLIEKTGGFFIEAGANDGEYLSNTLQLERVYKWTGLLIEPNPFMLSKLRLKNRKAWIAGLCLSLQGYPQKMRFMHRVDPVYHPWFAGMGIIEHSADNPVPPQTQRDPNNYIYAGPVDCFPLYSVLLALNQTVVDYFSLDIEGIELRVLKAIPFNLVTIKFFSIEYNLIPEGEKVLTEFLESKGYKILFKKNVEMFAVHKDFITEFDLS